MAWWQLGRNRREPVAGAAASAPPLISSAEPDGAWRDLPALQRTLDEPVRPVAISDDFRDSLASYADPSFMAPLAHQVDPNAGGWVEGLASPGVPYAYSGGSELAVPARPKPVVSRRAGLATSVEPAVQRSVITSSSADLPTDLPTVALELPDIGSPTSDTEPDTPSSRPTFSADAPLIAGASATKWGVTGDSASGGGSDPAPRGSDPAPAAPTRELPVVARSVDHAAPELPLPTRSTTTAVPSAPRAAPTTSSAGPPVVSRSAEPAVKSAPLSGFAEAIARLNEPGETSTDAAENVISDDHVVAGDDHVVAGDDHVPAPVDQVDGPDGHAAPSVAAASLPIQRVAAQRPLPVGREAEMPVVVPAAPTSTVRDSSLPVVSRHVDTASNSGMRPGPVSAMRPEPVEGRASTVQRHIAASSDAPTLGLPLTQVPLTVERAALMTERVPTPAEPTVQRVEFLTPHVVRVPQPGPALVADSFSTPVPEPAPQPTTPEFAPQPTTPAPAPITATPAVQRLLSRDGKPGPNAPSAPSSTISRRETVAEDVAVERPVQRLESLPALAPAAAAFAFSEVTPPPERSSASPMWHMDAPPTGPAVTELATRSPDDYPPLGPAVIPEPLTVAAEVSVPTRTTPTSHPAMPTIAIGPSIPIQRSAAISAPSGMRTASPLIVPHQSREEAASTEAPASDRMSFAAMFASVTTSDSGSPAEDGFTSVQLQSAGDSAPPAESPATSSTPPTTSTAPPPATAGASGDLDELARRLYEPLTARLRAELWLDRERAGVTSDL
jgi:hypothetical protein